jgi:hypothetical protein
MVRIVTREAVEERVRSQHPPATFVEATYTIRHVKADMLPTGMTEDTWSEGKG